jgi:nucleotide-binding universal stress UspA family protein
MLRDTEQPVLVVKRRADGPYRQVLVAEDLSIAGAPSIALAYARAIAPGAMFNVVHAYHVPSEGKMRYAGVDDALIEKYRGAAQAEAMGKMIEMISSSPSPPDVRLVLAHGHPVSKLIEKEQELRADLIVVARRDKSLAERLLSQSVTWQLLERAQCDVLIVR